ncbi:MAG: hypothetical protein ACOC9S_00730 [Planctomycetota bacterium]
MPAKRTNIDEMQQELEMKLQRLDELKSRRDEIDAEIAELMGMGAYRSARKRAKSTRGRVKTAKRKTAGKKTGRGRRGKPLVEYIKDVLKKHPEGMRVKEIEQAVRKAGYKTSSKDFYGIIASTVRDTKNFKKIKRGVYTLKG